MIPKTLHRVWIQGRAALPERYAVLGDTFLRHNPGWTAIDWCMDDVYNGRLTLSNPSVFERMRAFKPAFLSDIIRYEVLFQYGGVYTDYDVLWHRSVEDITIRYPFFSAFESSSSVCNAVIGSAPFHPVLGKCLRYMASRFETYTDPADICGVKMFTHHCLEHEGSIALLTPPFVHRLWGHDHSAMPTAKEVVDRPPTNAIATHLFAHARGESFVEAVAANVRRYA